MTLTAVNHQHYAQISSTIRQFSLRFCITVIQMVRELIYQHAPFAADTVNKQNTRKPMIWPALAKCIQPKIFRIQHPTFGEAFLSVDGLGRHVTQNSCSLW